MIRGGSRSNSRFNLIHKPLSDLFLVHNEEKVFDRENGRASTVSPLQ